MTTNVIKYNVKVRVSFDEFGTGIPIIDVSNSLIGLATNKALGRAAGTWQIMLRYKQLTTDMADDGTSKTDYPHKLLKPNDVVNIMIDAGDGNGEQVVMTGLIDRLSVVRMGGYDVRRQIKISGQDLGKILINHDVGWDIQVAKEQIVREYADDIDKAKDVIIQGNSRLAMNKIYSVGTPTSLCQNMFKIMFATVVSQSIVKYFDTDNLELTDDTWRLLSNTFNSLHGVSLWQAMKSVENAPYNILHADTDERGILCLSLEKQPFDSNGKLERDADRQHYIEAYDIIDSDVGMSDEDRINFLFHQINGFVPMFNIQVDIWVAVPALIRHETLKDNPLNSIEMNGYCYKSFQTNFLPPEFEQEQQKLQNKQVDKSSSVYERTELYWQWYNKNHLYHSGQFKIHCKPTIRCGDMLVEQIDEFTQMQYYVEQVAHSVIFAKGDSPVAETTLSVTRGQEHAA